jgi:tetratricopeptide (TPR) repeat protein
MVCAKNVLLTRFCSAALVAALVITPAVAQQAGQTPPGSGQTPPGTGGTSPPPSPTPVPTPTTPSPNAPPEPTWQPGQHQPKNQYPTMQDFETSILLSGKVVLEDGTPPQDFVVIERICNGIGRPEGYTDSKGRFSFQLGQNKLLMAEASIDFDSIFGNRSGSGVSERQLLGCEIRASLPGYISSVVQLTGRHALDDPDLGTIVLRRNSKVEGTFISLTSLQVPDQAKKAFDKGRDTLRQEKWADARKQFEKAVGIYPQYAQAWCELGTALERLNDVSGARAAYGKAVAADANFVKPYLQMAGIAAKQQNWRELLDSTAHVVKLDSFDYPGIFFLKAVAEYNLENIDAAEKSAREALKIDTEKRHPEVNHLLAVILARKGEFKAAADYLSTYLKLAPAASDVAQAKQELAEIEKVARLTSDK